MYGLRIPICFIVAVLALQMCMLPVQAHNSSICATFHKDPGDNVLEDDSVLKFVIAGSNLPSKDRHSEADAFVKVYVLMPNNETAFEQDHCEKTEVVKNSADPHWNNVFSFKHEAGSGEILHFILRDHDVLNPDDEMGWAALDADEYVEQNQYSNLSVSGGGFLVVRKADPKYFRLYARNLPRKDQFNGRSDSFVQAYWRYGMDGRNNPLGSTSVIDNDDNPDWKEKFQFAHYQKGMDQYWYFQIFDSDTVSPKDFVGDILVQVDPIFENKDTKTFNLTNSEGGATLSIIPL